MESNRQGNKLIWGLLIICLTVFLIIIGQNIYDSLYPPVFFPQKIDVAKVKRRIENTGLTPREALFYKVIELDTRLKPQDKKSKNGKD